MGTGWRPDAHLEQRDTAPAAHKGVNPTARPEATNSVNHISDSKAARYAKRGTGWSQRR